MPNNGVALSALSITPGTSETAYGPPQTRLTNAAHTLLAGLGVTFLSLRHRATDRDYQVCLTVDRLRLKPEAEPIATPPGNRLSSAAMDIDNFITRAQLSLDCKPSEHNTDLHPDEIPEDCDHFKCALRGRTHEMEFYFTCPTGSGPPRIQDVTRYLGAVAAEYENCDDMLEWANEYGFDPRHMDTRGAFDAIARLTRDLWRMIGDDMFDTLRHGVEIEQAVDIAWAGFQNSSRN